MLSPSLEDYLEEVYRLSSSGDPVRVTDISNRLNVSLPSVTKALHKLNELNYINYQRYGEIELTDKGVELGSFLVRRNQLLQEFLILIGSHCDAEAEAEAMEHYLSAETISAIQSLVTFLKEHPEWHQDYLEFLTRHSKPSGN